MSNIIIKIVVEFDDKSSYDEFSKNTEQYIKQSIPDNATVVLQSDEEITWLDWLYRDESLNEVVKSISFEEVECLFN